MIAIAIFILPFLVMTSEALNCTLDKLCGSRGYCYNATDEYWSCECKFWWEGPVCNQQSDSGKQIIVLGSLAGFLIFLFFGLKIGRLIYLRQTNVDIEIKETTDSPKLVTVAIDQVKKTTKLTSCLITVLMIIIAVAALMSDWVLLRKIHKDIVKQYEQTPDDPLYYNRTSFCDILDVEDFNVFTFPFACLLVVLCIVITKRKSFFRTICHGYIAPPIPVDFLSHVDRKFAAVIFAIIANDLLDIMRDVITGGSNNKGRGALVSFLLRILQVIFMGVRYFPILAAVYINSIFILTCATLYAWLDYAFIILTQGMCYPDYYPDYDDYIDGSTDINDKLKYYGTGASLLAIEVCTDIPRFLCLAYVSVKLPMLLIEKIYFYRRNDLSDENKMLTSLSREENILLRISRPDSVEMLYVKNLFLSPDERPRSQSLFSRVIPKFIYEWRDDFRFSSRVLCVYSSVFLLLYLVIIWTCVELVSFFNTIQEDFQGTIDAITNAILTTDDELSQSSFPIPKLVRPFLLAVAMTATIIVIQLIILLVNIRRNLIQAFRGDASEIPRRRRSEYVSYATGNFHFAGYFIGYLIWGFILITAFSTIICACIDAFVVYGSVRILEKLLKAIIPSILLIIFKLFLNKLLAQYVFLQHCGDVLALDNRRFLMIFIFFNFFLDAFLGFISSIIRFVKSIIAGIVYMCRLDYSILGRKLETMDSGFSAYCGFIHTECTHRHPIMLVFVSHLYNEIKKKQHSINQVHSDGLSIQEKDLIQQKKSLRYIHKWRLAVFLVQNPVVIFFRKAYLRQLSVKHVRALNDVDNDHEYSVQRGMVFYATHMTAQRANLTSGDEPAQIISMRL